MDWGDIIVRALSIAVPLGAFVAWLISRLDKKLEKIDKRLEKIDDKIERISSRVARLEGATWRNGTGG